MALTARQPATGAAGNAFGGRRSDGSRAAPHTGRRNGANTSGGKSYQDEDDEDDRVMDRNPADFPFPSFQPTEADVVRKKHRAMADIMDMVHGLKAVVPFSKPNMAGVRQPWHSDAFLKRPPTPKMDWSCHPDGTAASSPLPPPTLVQPKWVSHIPRAKKDCCPQLGLPKGTSDDDEGGLSARHKTIRPPPGAPHVHHHHRPKLVSQQRDGQSLSKLLHAASVTPRYELDHRNDSMMELLRDPVFVKEIHRHASQRKSVLVTLPKIGVRLFSLNGAHSLAECIRGSSPRPDMAKSGKLAKSVSHPDVAQP